MKWAVTIGVGVLVAVVEAVVVRRLRLNEQVVGLVGSLILGAAIGLTWRLIP